MEVDFFRSLNLNEIKPIYYISGSNSWLKQRCLNKIVNEIKMQKNSCEVYNFEGKNVTINDIVDICESIPLGYDFKCIVIKDWELDKINAKEMEIIVDVFSDLADFCSVIIVNMNVSVLKTKIKKLIDVIKKTGLCLDLKDPSQTDIVNFIVKEVKNNGCSITNIVARRVMECCSNDLNKISQEINKLVSYCNQKEITLEDVDLIVVSSLEVRIFDMIKLINGRNLKKALKLLDNLLTNKEEPIAILSIISMTFLDVYRAKVTKQAKKHTEDLVELFDYKGKEFRVGKAFIESEKYSFVQLEKIINLLIETDYKLKMTILNKKILLEEMLIKIFNYLEG